MSRHASELCTLLVDDLLGELAAKIFHTLCESSHLPLDVLAQKTQLGRKQLKHGLAVLIQQNLILWDDESGTAQPHYEACLERAYQLSQYGRFLRIVESWHGKTASRILEEVLVQGSMTVHDLEQDYIQRSISEDGETSQRDHGPRLTMDQNEPRRLPNGKQVLKNGLPRANDRQHARDTREDGAKTFHVALRTLRLDRLLLRYNDSFRRPETDNRREAENLMSHKPGFEPPIKKAEIKREFVAAVENTLVRWKMGEDVASDDDEVTPAPSKKRKARDGEEGGASKKRPRLEDSNPPSTSKQGVSFANDGRTRPHSTQLPPDGSAEFSQDMTLLVVNFCRLEVLLRDEVLTSEAARAIGPVTARIYTQILRLASTPLPACQPLFVKDVPRAEMTDYESLDNHGAITTNRLIQQMAHLEDLENGMVHIADASLLDSMPERFARGLPTKDQLAIDTPIEVRKNDIESDFEEDDEREDDEGLVVNNDASRTNGHILHDHQAAPSNQPSDLIRQHLLLLSTHSLPFLLHRPRVGHRAEAWVVPYAALVRALRVDLICETIHAQHDELLPAPPPPPPPPDPNPSSPKPPPRSPRPDTTALRIARILSETGKLDEKTLAARSLVSPKVLRARCAALHRAGLLELQDVPRDTQRQASRSMFLWFLDPERAAARLVDKAMADMCRLIKRRGKEKALRRGVLEKAERLDVRGKEEMYLSAGDRKLLERWRDKENRFWSAVNRLGGAVDLLSRF